MMSFFFFKQKTAYEMRISDWSSDVCSSDLPDVAHIQQVLPIGAVGPAWCVELVRPAAAQPDAVPPPPGVTNKAYTGSQGVCQPHGDSHNDAIGRKAH